MGNVLALSIGVLSDPKASSNNANVMIRYDAKYCVTHKGNHFATFRFDFHDRPGKSITGELRNEIVELLRFRNHVCKLVQVHDHRVSVDMPDCRDVRSLLLDS